MMSVGAEVPSAGENEPVNPNNSAWDVRPFMVPPLGEMKKGVPVLHGGKQFLNLVPVATTILRCCQ